MRKYTEPEMEFVEVGCMFTSSDSWQLCTKPESGNGGNGLGSDTQGDSGNGPGYGGEGDGSDMND